MIYFDYAASTPTDEDIIEMMADLNKRVYANPSSIHRLGQESKLQIDMAREVICDHINAQPLEICFSSGGTEANNLAILGYAFANIERGRHIISSKIEHKSVLKSLEFLEKHFSFKIDYLDHNKDGMIDMSQLKKICNNETILLSLMHVNNELGSLNHIEEIGLFAREKKIAFHVDAIQSFGKMALKMDNLPVDLLTASSHKIYGPKAVGFTFVRKGILHEKALFGGAQEFDKRAGTENIIGIAGFAKAIEKRQSEMHNENKMIQDLFTYFGEKLKKQFPDSIINGSMDNRIPNIVNFSIPGERAEDILMKLDQEQIYLSSGSACTSGSRKASHVIESLKLDDRIKQSSMRLSFGKHSNTDQINTLFEHLTKIVKN
jgi:cysteine desulfurase